MRVFIKIKNYILEIKKDMYARKKIAEARKILKGLYD